MGLTDLPSELMLQIASFLVQVDLLNFSLTNKAFRNATESELYRDYLQVSESRRSRNSRKTQRVSLRLFILRLLERPELAKHVRRVELKTLSHLEDFMPQRIKISSGYRTIPADYMPLTQDEYERLAQAAKALNVITAILPYTEVCSLGELVWQKVYPFKAPSTPISYRAGHRYFFKFCMGDENSSYETQFCTLLYLCLDDPLIVLLMALLPRVKDLILGDTSYNFLPWRINHQFSSLRSLTISSLRWPKWFFDTTISGGLLEKLTVIQLPRDSVVGHGMFEDYKFEMLRLPVSFQDQSTHITHLRLSASMPTNPDLRIMLSACPTLKSLSCQCFSDNIGNDWENASHITLLELVELLNSHKKSLEELELDIGIDNLDERYRPLPCMRDFTALKLLAIDARICSDTLYSPGSTESLFTYLPQSITSLVLIDKNFNREPSDCNFVHLEKLLSLRHESLPKLKCIRYVEALHGSAKSTLDDFEVTFSEAAIDKGDCYYEILKWSEYRQTKMNETVVYPKSLMGFHGTRWDEDKGKYVRGTTFPKRHWSSAYNYNIRK